MRSLKNETLVLKIDPDKPDKRLIAYCAAVVQKGGIVAFPTETVYGLAANLLKKKTLDRLYRAKKRPRSKPFTVHIADTAVIKKMGCDIDRAAKALIARFWPGPLTIILRSKSGKNIGFRMPANKIALELIRRAGVPVVAPSANASGARPPKNAGGVLKTLDGKIDLVLDGGSTKIGVESTVIDLTARPFRILRRGAVKAKDILCAVDSNS